MREKDRNVMDTFVSMAFRFLSPTKLNRNELAGYSKAQSIQPLCLWGVGVCFVVKTFIKVDAVAD